MYKWTWVVHTYVVQGSSAFQDSIFLGDARGQGWHDCSLQVRQWSRSRKTNPSRMIGWPTPGDKLTRNMWKHLRQNAHFSNVMITFRYLPF